jgi:hypothetical protein
MYQWILDNYNCGKADFHTIQDAYTDYSFVIDIENKTFRLPILNGEENIPGTNYENITFPSNTSYTITKPVNGFYSLDCRIAHAGNGVVINDKVSKTITRCNCPTENCLCDCSLFVPANHETGLYKASLSTNNPSDKCYFIPAIGNGSLYFYVGETVQNANLINASKVQESISQLKDSLKTMLDGDIVPVGVTLASNATISANRVTYDISNILPKDDYNYEVMVCGQVLTKATKGSYVNLYVTSDIQTNSIFVSGIVADSAYQVNTMGCALVVVGKQRILNVEPNTSGTGTYYLYVQNYKRLGKIV